MKKDVSSYYFKLTPEERFKLVLKARARSDDKDAKNLHQSCQKVTYIMNDDEYDKRFEALRTIWSMFIALLANSQGMLEMTENAFTFISVISDRSEDSLMKAYLQGFEDADGEKPNYDKALNKLDVIVKAEKSVLENFIEAGRNGVMQRARNIYSSFEGFCQDFIGLSIKTVIDSFDADELVSWIDMDVTNKPDIGETKKLKKEFRDYWIRIVKEGHYRE